MESGNTLLSAARDARHIISVHHTTRAYQVVQRPGNAARTHDLHCTVLTKVPLVLFMLIERAFRAVGFSTDADEATVYLIRSTANALLRLVSTLATCSTTALSIGTATTVLHCGHIATAIRVSDAIAIRATMMVSYLLLDFV